MKNSPPPLIASGRRGKWGGRCKIDCGMPPLSTPRPLIMGIREMDRTGGSTTGPDSNALNVLRAGFKFQVLSNPKSTWTATWEQLRTALTSRGHTALNLRSVHKMSSQWQPGEIPLSWYGSGTERRRLGVKTLGHHIFGRATQAHRLELPVVNTACLTIPYQC